MTTDRTLPYPAPDFSLKDTDGVTRTLGDYKGKWLVLYFYPKDDTPGCTTEACSMRDSRDDLADAGAEVIGVSMDPPELHEKFKTKFQLNFTLLSDPDRVMIDAYDAWGKKMFGNEGILRKTYIIDPEGMVRKIYGRVTPLNHGTQVLEELKKLQSV